MKFTIITSLYGTLPVVKECIDSWLPLPPNWNLIVYNSAVSSIDGTTDYIRQKQKEHNFLLIEDGKTRSHTSAIKTIIPSIDGDWVLHLDSDAKLLNKFFFLWAEATAKSKKYKVYGKVDKRISARIAIRERYIHNNTVNEMYLPRCHQWLMMFEKEYFIQKNISFDDIIMTAKITSHGKKLASQDGTKNYDHGDEIFIFGDTSWQLFWESIGDDLFCSFPDEAYNCWKHLNNQSCKWDRVNRELILSGSFHRVS